VKLEKRVAVLLGLEVADLPAMRLGVLVNILFALVGDSHELGSYFATSEGLCKVLGREAVWDDPEVKTQESEPAETPKAVVN
jgi:hypothetical protein